MPNFPAILQFPLSRLVISSTLNFSPSNTNAAISNNQHHAGRMLSLCWIPNPVIHRSLLSKDQESQ